jgi:hypothetical protein
MSVSAGNCRSIPPNLSPIMVVMSSGITDDQSDRFSAGVPVANQRFCSLVRPGARMSPVVPAGALAEIQKEIQKLFAAWRSTVDRAIEHADRPTATG